LVAKFSLLAHHSPRREGASVRPHAHNVPCLGTLPGPHAATALSVCALCITAGGGLGRAREASQLVLDAKVLRHYLEILFLVIETLDIDVILLSDFVQLFDLHLL